VGGQQFDGLDAVNNSRFCILKKSGENSPRRFSIRFNNG